MADMSEIAKLIHQNEGFLRPELQHGRTGLFRKGNGEVYVLGNLQLGHRSPDETIMIFADEFDLDLFYKMYLPKS
ncbi:MAG TPA: hypothetical protein DHU63_07280 [Candidatus Marinimicrobia bacterium]|nr:MAG: hypothetical protein AUJ47_11635 [Candidatus Marinimicrobia bacterium CG1_02_48_14]HCW76324.1 hypothetical protein [Candidatus Neomarinimicrobiota bacterium]